MTIIGIWIDDINSQRINKLVKDKYIDIANKIVLDIENTDKTHQLIKQYDLKILDDISNKNIKTLYHQKHTFGFIHIFQKEFDDEFILHIKYLNTEYILETADEENINDRRVLNLLVILDILLLIGIFLYIFKLIYPLKKITDNIDNFAKGEYNSRVDITSNDEIGTLAKTYNKMASEIEDLIKTRENLLRDIGHELRTPIAKGNFVLEKIEDKSQKQILKKIFKDLEELTSELIELEKLNSTKLNISTFDAETLIIQSLNKLYIDNEENIELLIENNFNIKGDLDYLSIVFKNLIDNALKYTTKNPIFIEIKNKEIIVKNSGLELKKDISHYIKPFVQELPQRDGFGLGLSIVNKILYKHNLFLHYEYKDKMNCFKVKF